jgi:hypothetical protein
MVILAISVIGLRRAPPEIDFIHINVRTPYDANAADKVTILSRTLEFNDASPVHQ